MEKRNYEKYVVTKAMTERYRRSSIPSMQRLLNNAEREKREIIKKILVKNPITEKIKPPIIIIIKV